MIDRLNAMLEKYDELSNKLTSEEVLNNYELLKNISKEKSDLEETVDTYKEYKKVIKQGKNKEKFLEVLNKIANGEELETKYRNHKLINNNIFKDCYECHISHIWLLVYF